MSLPLGISLSINKRQTPSDWSTRYLVKNTRISMVFTSSRSIEASEKELEDRNGESNGLKVGYDQGRVGAKKRKHILKLQKNILHCERHSQS